MADKVSMDLDWIATCPECGHLLCWHAAGRHAAEDVADWITRGLNIERVTTEAARNRPWDHPATCSQYKPPRPKQQTLFAGKAGE